MRTLSSHELESVSGGRLADIDRKHAAVLVTVPGAPSANLVFSGDGFTFVETAINAAFHFELIDNPDAPLDISVSAVAGDDSGYLGFAPIGHISSVELLTIVGSDVYREIDNTVDILPDYLEEWDDVAPIDLTTLAGIQWAGILEFLDSPEGTYTDANPTQQATLQLIEELGFPTDALDAAIAQSESETFLQGALEEEFPEYFQALDWITQLNTSDVSLSVAETSPLGSALHDVRAALDLHNSQFFNDLTRVVESNSDLNQALIAAGLDKVDGSVKLEALIDAFEQVPENIRDEMTNSQIDVFNALTHLHETDTLGALSATSLNNIDDTITPKPDISPEDRIEIENTGLFSDSWNLTDELTGEHGVFAALASAGIYDLGMTITGSNVTAATLYLASEALLEAVIRYDESFEDGRPDTQLSTEDILMAAGAITADTSENVKLIIGHLYETNFNHLAKEALLKHADISLNWFAALYE